MASKAPRPLKVASKPRAEAEPAPACATDADGCEISELFRLLGKAHVLDILYVMNVEAQGPMRFVDLQKRLRLSPNTLSERLKELVESGLLSRTAYNEIPPRVDYAATAKAKDLEPVFTSLFDWSKKHNLKPVPVEVLPDVKADVSA